MAAELESAPLPVELQPPLGMQQGDAGRWGDARASLTSLRLLLLVASGGVDATLDSAADVHGRLPVGVGAPRVEVGEVSARVVPRASHLHLIGIALLRRAVPCFERASAHVRVELVERILCSRSVGSNLVVLSSNGATELAHLPNGSEVALPTLGCEL